MRTTVMTLIFVAMVSICGCAGSRATGISDDGDALSAATIVDIDRAVALARIIARKAGRYVALNNPQAAAAVSLAYAVIETETGERFRAAFFYCLHQFMAENGIRNSAELRADAADILALFGHEIDATVIDMDLLAGVEVDAIKAVAGAFIDGMRIAEVTG